MGPLRLIAGIGLAAGGLALTAALTWPDSSLASTPATPYEPPVDVEPPEVQADSWFGDGLARTDDLDGDGVADFYAGQPRLDVGDVTDQGRVYAMSGRDRTVLHTIDSPEPQAEARFGSFFDAFGDADGDGTTDVVIGTDAQDVYTGSGDPCGTEEPNGCNEDQGKAWVFSGEDGSVLYALDNPNPQGSPDNTARFGSRVGSAGDVTGDGVGDVLIGAPRNDIPAACGDESPLPEDCRVDEGETFVFDGTDGDLVRTLNLPPGDPEVEGLCTSSCGWLGSAVQGVGDTDGDGVVDHLVSAPSFSVHTGSGDPCGTEEPNGCNELQGRLYLFSGADGELLHRLDSPFPAENTFFGFQDVAPLAPGDVNGDGRSDVYGALSETGQFEGQGIVFDGASGEFLYSISVPDAQEGHMLWSLDRSDYNHDGVPDLYAGILAVATVPEDENGGSFVYDGRDGSLLKTLPIPEAHEEPGRRVTDPPNAGPFLGWSLLAFDDLNDDGQPDYLASAPEKDLGDVKDPGRLYFFHSRSLLAQACPNLPEPGFTDLEGNIHADAIGCIASHDLAEGGPSGLPDDQYGPGLFVRRDQVASFVARLIDLVDPGALPAAEGDAFPCSSDPDQAVTPGNVHHDNIQRLAAAGVVAGGPGGLPDDCYGAGRPVRRDQMASFLNRSIGAVTGQELSADSDFFGDDDGNVHEDNINAVAAEEIVRGTGEGRYDPSSAVRRDQMGSFVARSLGFFVQTGEFTP